MLSEATQKSRDVLAVGLLGVSTLIVVSGLSLLFKSGDDLGGADFAAKAMLFGPLFTAVVVTGPIVLAVVLVTAGEPSRLARPVVLVALAIGAVAVLFGLITWFASYGVDDELQFGGFGGVAGAGKLVGTLLAIAGIVLLALALLFIGSVWQALPKPAPTPQQWGQQPWGQPPGGQPGQQPWGQQPGGQPGQQPWAQQPQGQPWGQQYGQQAGGQPYAGQQGGGQQGGGQQYGGQQWAADWGDQAQAQAQQQGQPAASWGQQPAEAAGETRVWGGGEQRPTGPPDEEHDVPASRPEEEQPGDTPSADAPSRDDEDPPEGWWQQPR